MEWTWDARKAAANLVSHGLSFETAMLVFDDPFHRSWPDPHSDDDRWRTIGRVNQSTLFVVHTIVGDGETTGRIISARKATRSERLSYEQGG